jgi:Acetyltransferase (GNAT) domain
MTPRVQSFADVASLPADARAMLDAAERQNFQLGAAWFGAVAAAALPPGTQPLFLLCREGARALALLPLLRRPDRRLAGLTTLYTCLFRPLAAADASAEDLRRAGRAFGRHCRRFGPLRLDALDPDWPGMPPLLSGLRQSGLAVLRFSHFGNWHVPVADLGWSGYLAGRPGDLRQTIKRRLARAARDPAVRFEMVTGGAGLEAGIAAYEAVYASSWKPQEPYPAFTGHLLRAAAGAGVLRLPLLWRAGVPVAAQYWTVTGGTATLLKLAHDEAARSLSPGTVLTALTIRHLLEQEGVTELDFGRGDDEYKSGWTGQLRMRGGVLLCPWWQPSGLLQLGRHFAGQYLPHRRMAVAASPDGGGRPEVASDARI